jgi:hypothetical protein
LHNVERIAKCVGLYASNTFNNTLQQINLLFAPFILFKGKFISPSLKKEIFHRGGYYTSHLAFILIHLFFFFLFNFKKGSFGKVPFEFVSLRI